MNNPLKRTLYYTALFLVIQLLIHSVSVNATEIDSLQRLLISDKLQEKDKAEVNNKLALLYSGINSDKATYYANTAISISNKYGNKYQKILGYYYLGYIELHQNRFIPALHFFLKAKKEAIQNNYKFILADVYDAVSEIYIALNNQSKAYYYINLSLLEAQRNKDTLGVLYSYVSLAKSLIDVNKIAEASSYIQATDKLLHGFKNVEDIIALNEFERAKIFYKNKNFDTAITLLNQVKNFFSKLNMQQDMADVSLQKTYIYLSTKQINKIPPEIDFVIEVAHNLKNRILEAKAYDVLADYYYYQNNYNASANYAFKAIHIYDSVGLKVKLANTYAHIFKLYTQQKNLKALNQNIDAYWKHINNHKDQELANEIEKILSEFDDDLVQEQMNVLATKNRDRKLQFYFLLIVFIITLILLLVIIRQYKQRTKTIKIVEEQAKQLEQSNKELQKSLELKNKIFSIISHDLRSPLTSTYQLVDLFNKGFVNEHELKNFGIMLQNEIASSLHLTDNLLHWAKGQMVEYKPAFSKVDIQKIVQRIIHSLNNQLSSKNIIVNNQLQDLEVQTDADILTIVIRNLLSNAIKFSYNNSTINIFLHSRNTENWLVIEDKGVGMTQEQLTQLLNKQLSSNLGTNKEKGAGIGFSLVQDLLKSIHKKIEINSTAQKGTSVFIQL